MPPANPQHGDVLDRALTAARAQTPAGKGFFNALKPQSSLFPQTTRVNVADLPAQARQQARVVPPPYTPPVAPPTPRHTSVRGISQPADTRPAHNPLGSLESIAARMVPRSLSSAIGTAGATVGGPLALIGLATNPAVKRDVASANTAVNKGIASLGPAQPSAGLQGAASSNAGILNATKGIPYANLSGAGQQAIRKAALFFAQNPSYHYNVPDLGIFGPKDKAEFKLPPTATDGDYIRALGNEAANLGHRNYLDTLVHNLPTSTLQFAAAPLAGAYLATHPISGGKEFAKENIAFGKGLVTDPLGTLENQPIPTIATVLGLARTAGGIGGTVARTGIAGEAARAFATPAERNVIPAGFDLKTAGGERIPAPAIPRGMTSPKLDERLAQAAADKLAAKVPFFGNRLDQSFRSDITRGSHQASSQIEQAALDPAIRAAAKLNKHEVRAVTALHGQGFHTLGEAKAYFAKQASDHAATEQAAIDHVGNETHADWQVAQRHLDTMAKLTDRLHAKLGDQPTAKMADALSKLTGATRSSEAQLSSLSRQGTTLPLVPEDTMLRRAYGPRARIDAELHGKPEAQQFLQTTHELNALHPEIQKAPENALPTTATREIDQIQRSQANDLGKQLSQAQRRLAQAKQLRGRTAPGQKPILKASPGAIRKLETRVGALADAKARVESGDYTNSRIKQLQDRAVPTRTQLEDTRTQISGEQATALHAVRSQFRAERGAPLVEQGAPLDVHDPLFFQHVMEGTKGLRGVFRGQGKGTMNENVATKFGGGRLGHEGQQSTSQLFSDARANTDPAVYFGGVAKPFKVAAALRHFRSQVESSIIAPKAGTRYSTDKYVRIRADGGGMPNAEVPTSADALQAVHELSDQSLRDQIMSGIKQESKGQESYIPDDGHEYYLMTRHAADNLENTFKGYDSKTLRAIRHTTGIWRWATLMARPAWLVNNAAGATIQAATAGAGVVSGIRALRTGPGQKFEGTFPEQTQNTGLFKNTFGKPTGFSSTAMKPIHAFTNIVVDINNSVENWARRAVAIRAGSAEAKAAYHGQVRTVISNFHRLTPEVIELMKNPSPEAEARVVKQTDTWLGNYTRLKATPGFDVISPFHRWFRFIGKLVVEMPVKTPGRALLLQRLGAFGVNIQNQQFGGFVPNSMQGSFQLPASLPYVGGLWKGTQGLNPYATPYQLLAPNDQSTTNPGQPNAQGLLGGLNPGFGALWNYARGTDFQTGATLKDQNGNPVGNFNPGVLGHGLLGSVPFYSLLAGYNAADNTVSPFGPKRPAKATDQPQQSLLDRALGYTLGSVKPYNAELNRDKSIKRLKTAVVTEARNKLANS